MGEMGEPSVASVDSPSRRGRRRRHRRSRGRPGAVTSRMGLERDLSVEVDMNARTARNETPLLVAASRCVPFVGCRCRCLQWVGVCACVRACVRVCVCALSVCGCGRALHAGAGGRGIDVVLLRMSRGRVRACRALLAHYSHHVRRLESERRQHIESDDEHESNGKWPQSADIEAVAVEGGSTALSIACRRGCVPVVRELLRWRANVNSVNADGYTPLMRAVENGTIATPHHTTPRRSQWVR